MEAKLDLSDGFKGTAKSVAGQKLRLTIEGPDTELGRAFLLDCLFNLQTKRYGYEPQNVTRTDYHGKGFPLVTVDRPIAGPNRGTETGNHHGYACFTIREDRYGGFPIFDTFGACREDFEAAIRAAVCLNRHSDMPTAQILSLPHAADSELAYDILLRTVADVLRQAGMLPPLSPRKMPIEGQPLEPKLPALTLDKYTPPVPVALDEATVRNLLEILQAGFDESRRINNPGWNNKDQMPPEVRFTAPHTGEACSYCSGKPEDGYMPCPFKGYRPGECFKLTQIQPQGNKGQ